MTVLGLCVVAAITIVAERGGGRWIEGRQIDLLAFYCAGSSIAGGHDSYRAEPLRSCEVASLRAARAPSVEHLAIPAPLPGYALAFFTLFARLTFAQASILFSLMLVAAMIATLFALRELTAQPLLVIFGALVLGDDWVCLGYGQIVPLALMFLCFAARFVARNRPVGAACCAAAAMIEPHVALPACLALFLFQPRTRAALIICATLLGGLSVGTLGWATNLEYFNQVLPMHALAESNQIGQFSLTTLLHQLGVDSTLALKIADLSYIGMCQRRDKMNPVPPR